MANMNKKSYWKARKLIKTILFRIKVFLFRIVDMVESFWEYHPFRRMILRSILSGGIKALILAICVLLLDSLSFRILPCFGIEDILTVDPSIFVDVVIGSIGVAGVILGLYCANVSSIYSTRYAIKALLKDQDAGEMKMHIKDHDYSQMWNDYNAGHITASELTRLLFSHH